MKQLWYELFPFFTKTTIRDRISYVRNAKSELLVKRGVG